MALAVSALSLSFSATALAEPTSDSTSAINEGEGFTFIGSFENQEKVEKEHPKAKVYTERGFTPISERLRKLDKSGDLTDNVIIQIGGGDSKISKKAAKLINDAASNGDRKVVIYVPDKTEAFDAVNRAKDKGFLDDVSISAAARTDDNDEALAVSDQQVSAASDFVERNAKYWQSFNDRNAELSEKEKQLDAWYEKLMSGGGGSGSSGDSSSQDEAGGSGTSCDPKDSSGGGKSSDSIFLLGDSTSAASVTPLLEKGFKDNSGYKDVVIDAVGGSSLKEKTDGTTGVDRLKKLLDNNKDSDVLIAMGTNDSANLSTSDGDPKDRIKEVLELTKDRKYVGWVQVAVGKNPKEANSKLDNEKYRKKVDEFNSTLDSMKSDYPNLNVIPWNPDEDQFSDGIHYTSEGYKDRVKTITSAPKTSGGSADCGESSSADDGDTTGDKSDSPKVSKEQWSDLKSKLDALAQSTGATTGYAVAPASGGAGISAGQSGKRIYTASTIKIPIAMAVQKNLKSDDNVTVAAADVVGGSGGTSAGEYTVSELLGRMIENSDNTATNALINKLGGFDKVNDIIAKTKVTDTKLDNMMMDGKNSSTITANDAVIILQKIWASSKGKSDILEKDKAQEIIDHMYKQQTRTKLPSKIPEAKVANKTGENTGISHDIGFITNGKFTVAIASINQFSGGDQAAIDSYTADAAKIAYDWIGSLSKGN